MMKKKKNNKNNKQQLIKTLRYHHPYPNALSTKYLLAVMDIQ